MTRQKTAAKGSSLLRTIAILLFVILMAVIVGWYMFGTYFSDLRNNGHTENTCNMADEVTPLADSDEEIRYVCPHCNGPQSLPESEIRCTIFRHGRFQHTWRQIPQHASREECDRYVRNNMLAEGCARPYRLVRSELPPPGTPLLTTQHATRRYLYTAVPCDYI